MRKGILVICLLLMIVGGGLSAAFAAELSPGLADYLATIGPDEKIRVVLRPVGAVDGLTLKRELAKTYARRADRHREALTRLQQAASISQATLVPVLNQLVLADLAADIKTYWIDNLISVDATAGAIAELALRDDLEKIYPFPEVTLINPTAIGSFAKRAAGAELNLRAIGADSMWALGLTGEGRLVGSIDTGIDGGHPALAAKWRGNNGYSKAESWFDPITGDSIPHTFGRPDGTNNEVARFYHGTATAGILVGHDPATGETTGVAFNAQWISAGVLDIPGNDIFEALQWMIDPDGDPNTEEDVPDVLNNSWGYVTLPIFTPAVGCDDLFWNTIDNLEAAGTVTIWAAGNEGFFQGVEYEQSIRNPANRSTSEVNTFSVGMVAVEELPDSIFITLNSSRGPSDCDELSFKPEVVAPGVNLTVPVPGGSYLPGFGGSSFAAPHVAGAVALLREYNPNATVDTIKKVLLLTATDLPGSPLGEDNWIGHGLINIPAALELMPANTEPHLYLKAIAYDRPLPGGQTEISLTVRNSGTAINNVFVDLIPLDSRLVKDTDFVMSFGDFAADEEKTGSGSSPKIFINEDVRPGERLPVLWEFTGDGYSRTVRGAIAVGEKSELDLYTHQIGNVVFTISSFGEYGLGDSSLAWRAGAAGFLHPADREDPTLFEMGFLVGNGPEHVSDAVRQVSDLPSNDFLTDASGKLRVLQPGDLADEQTFAAYSDAHADNPLGLFIEQRTFAYADTTDDDYVIMEYVLHNRSDSILTGVRAAMFADWDFPGNGPLVANSDFGRFDANAAVGWMMHKIEANRFFRGIAALTPGGGGEGMIAYRYITNDPFLYDGFTEAKKWHLMTGGFDTTRAFITRDASQMMTIGSFDIAPGDSAIAAFAIIGAEENLDIAVFARRAQVKYELIRPPADLVELTVEPTELVFSYEIGYQQPRPDTIKILNDCETCVDTVWNLVFNSSWLAVQPANGDTPAEVEVLIVSPETLALGEYFDTILVAVPGAIDSVRVPVTLHISEALAQIRVDPLAIGLVSAQTGALPVPVSLWIYNDGHAPLSWQATAGAAWINVDPVDGTVPALDSTTVELAIDTIGLAPGSYQQVITLDATGAVGSPQDVVVNYQLYATGITVGSESLSFESTENGPPPEQQTIWIYNRVFLEEMEWFISHTQDWTVVDPSGGTTPWGDSAGVMVRIEPAGLEPGEHYDTLVIDTDQPGEPSQRVSIFFMLETASVAGKTFNRPNPFDPDDPSQGTTEIYLGMETVDDLTIRIYDLAGELVRLLYAGPHSNGLTNPILWDGRADDGPLVADGVYLCHIEMIVDGKLHQRMLKIAVAKQ